MIIIVQVHLRKENIERRKVIRKIEQYEKKIATAKLTAGATPSEEDNKTIEELQNELKKWERDLVYVKVSK